MQRKNIVIAAAVAATVGAAALAFNGISYAQGWGMGPGMMGDYGPGYGHMGYGQGRGYGPGYGMMNGYGPGWMHSRGGYGQDQQGYGPGWCWRNDGSSNNTGPGPRYGQNAPQQQQQQQDLKLTTDDVKARMERWLARVDNPRLKLGDVKEKDADTITADIVTVDNSLVQRFEINRHSGYTEHSGG